MNNNCRKILYSHFERRDGKQLKKELVELTDSMKIMYEITVSEGKGLKQFLYNDVEEAIKKFDNFNLKEYFKSLKIISFNIDDLIKKVESYEKLRSDFIIIIKDRDRLKIVRYDSSDCDYNSDCSSCCYSFFIGILEDICYLSDFSELEFKFITLDDFN